MDRAPNAGPTFKPSGMILEQGRIDREARTGNWPNRLVTDYFDDDVKARSNQAALISYRADQAGETTISYGELDNLVSNIAGNLLALGVAKGDVISFQLPNWWEFVAVHLACLRVGAISNPLMPIFRAHELEYMLEHAGSKVLIVPKIFQKFDHQQLANRLQQEIPTLQHVFAVGGEGSNSFESALLAKPEALPAKHSPFTPNDVVQIMYTSGTTGRPKGVMHTSNTLLASACQVARRLQLGPDDVGFMAAPFAHQIGFCFGMIMPIVLGVPLVMMDIWNPLKAAQLISTHRASFTCASTPFMSDLANVPNVEEMDLDCFRMFLTAGAPVYEPVIAKVTQKLKVNVVPGWGMTEVIQATAALPISSLDQPLSDGFAFRGNEVRIVDGEGRSVQREKAANCNVADQRCSSVITTSRSFMTSTKRAGLIRVTWLVLMKMAISALSDAARISSSVGARIFPCRKSKT